MLNDFPVRQPAMRNREFQRNWDSSETTKIDFNSLPEAKISQNASRNAFGAALNSSIPAPNNVEIIWVASTFFD
jgi:hypothetical protein